MSVKAFQRLLRFFLAMYANSGDPEKRDEKVPCVPRGKQFLMNISLLLEPSIIRYIIPEDKFPLSNHLIV